MAKTSHDSETPAQGQQVITACAFLHRNFGGTEKLFLAKRAATKKFLPDVYELPGGHIEYGEDIVEGLKRELREEFGVEVAVGDPFFVFTYTNDVKGSHSIEVIYFVQLMGSPEDITVNPEDHSTSAWFAESELAKVYSSQKDADDIEFQAVRKGFAILSGERLKF